MADDIRAKLQRAGAFAIDALKSSSDGRPNNVLGIAAMLAATGFFVTGDAIMKLMSARLPTGETVFIRGLLGIILVWSLVAAMGALGEVRRHLTRLIAFRTSADMGAAGCFQIALSRLPFAETGAILQLNPLVVTASAAIFLGEKVGWRRWTATAVGFAGVLLIIRPGAAAFQWASLLLLGAVFCSASRDTITRRLPSGTSALILAAFAITGIAASSLLFLPFETWVWPAARDVVALALPAVFMLIGQTLVVISIRSGEVSAVVPFRYAAILWSLTYSALIWGEFPDKLTLLGIAIVSGAGLYTFHREQVRRREAAMSLSTRSSA